MGILSLIFSKKWALSYAVRDKPSVLTRMYLIKKQPYSPTLILEERLLMIRFHQFPTSNKDQAKKRSSCHEKKLQLILEPSCSNKRGSFWRKKCQTKKPLKHFQKRLIDDLSHELFVAFMKHSTMSSMSSGIHPSRWIPLYSGVISLVYYEMRIKHC